jgi:hypothetical protein
MKKILGAILLAASATTAVAAPPKVSAGTATVIDLKLDDVAAQQFSFSSVNPNQGPNGNTSGFYDAFLPSASNGQSTWTPVGKGNTGSASGSKDIGTTVLTWGYGVDKSTVPDPKNPKKSIVTSTSGDWWIKSSNTVVLDLTIAVHAGPASGAWLLDNLHLTQNDKEEGSFSIRWTNGGGQVPDFSNMTLFARDVTQVTSPVPEPETYAMFIAGLGVIGLVRRRRGARA